MNADLDVLIDRYYVTIPRAERMQIAAQIVRHLSDQVVPLLLFYDLTATAIGSRLRRVSWQGNELWSAYEWDVT
ncbi:MAG TPA: hypothetical protein VFC51_12915 [Chloroflexota bacterium]|nr:hypothetical protein [Chloroflexota bacterium]